MTALTSAFFVPVHGLVRLAHGVLGAFSIPRVKTQSDTDAAADGMAEDIERWVQGTDDFMGDHFAIFGCVQVLEHDGEFIAAPYGNVALTASFEKD